MKKTYLIPTIETLEVRSTFAICDGTVNEDLQNDPGGGKFAPKSHKPF
jgi:hypothetical protein